MNTVESFILFEDGRKENEKEQTTVWAKIVDGCLEISMRCIDYGWLKYAHEMQGGWNHTFDEANTKRFFENLRGEDQDCKKLLDEHFGNITKYNEIEGYCKSNNIVYTKRSINGKIIAAKGE